jgi:hypothetical protein
MSMQHTYISLVLCVCHELRKKTIGQSHAGETNSSSAGQNISSIVWNLMVHCHV